MHIYSIDTEHNTHNTPCVEMIDDWYICILPPPLLQEPLLLLLYMVRLSWSPWMPKTWRFPRNPGLSINLQSVQCVHNLSSVLL